MDALLGEFGGDEPFLIEILLGHHMLVILERGGRRRGGIVGQFGILEEDDEQAVPAVEFAQIGHLPLESIDAGEVGVEHDEAPTAEQLSHTVAHHRIVGLAEGGLLVVEAVHDGTHLHRLPGGRQEGVELFGEGDESHVVLLAYGHIGYHETGVDGVVEKGHAAEHLLHGAPLVDGAVHLLGAFLLVDVDHEMVAAGRRLPVDGAVVVALDIVLDVFKLGVVAHPAYALHAYLCEMVG